MKSFVVSVFLLLGSLQTFGQEGRKEVYIGFPVGISILDTTFGKNAAHLSEAVSYLESVKKDSTLLLTEVLFCGSASPEGKYSLNKRLANKRQTALESYIRSRVSIPDSIITRSSQVIAWSTLTELIQKSEMTNKDKAVSIIRNVPEFTYNRDGVLIDSRKKQLMDLQYGRAWQYMSKHFFHILRNASVILISVRPKINIPPTPITPICIDTTSVVDTKDTVSLCEKQDSVIPTFSHKHPFQMALKTNLLYDALAVPNIGIEIPFGKEWSLSADWMYGWWNKDSRHRYWRIYGGHLSFRKWFGRKDGWNVLSGHHLGLYGQIFTYDFEWGNKGYMGGKPGGTLWEKMNYAAGIEYGYSLPVARRLHLDFSIGIGYWGGKCYRYIPLDGHYVWQATKNRKWFGPTKTEVSLVWLLGSGMKNDKKGGVK